MKRVSSDPHGAGYRHQRLEVSILEELRSLLRDDVTDPSVEGLALTALTMSPDYKNARVHYVIPKGGDRKLITQGLERSTPFLRRRLSEAIELKRTPDLRFVFEAEIIE